MKPYVPADSKSLATRDELRDALTKPGRAVLAAVYAGTISWADECHKYPDDGPSYCFRSGPQSHGQIHTLTCGLDAFLDRLRPGPTQYILFDSFDEMVQYAVTHDLKWRA